MEEFLKQKIKEAGALAKQYFDAGVKHTVKSNLGDLLTDADIAVSEFLVSEIHAKYPDHHIKSEEMEEDINPGAEYEWVIDPVDGTRNFAMGISIWCQIVAVLKNGEPYMAAVYNPNADELFFAKVGEGAYMNDKKISVNNTEILDHAYAYIARVPEITGPYGTKVEEFRKAFVRMIEESNIWVHQYGTMLATCYLAMGGVDFWLQNAGLDHDFLAPYLICKEAGATITDADGNPWQRGRQDMIIANPKLHPKVMEFFK